MLLSRQATVLIVPDDLKEHQAAKNHHGPHGGYAHQNVRAPGGWRLDCAPTFHVVGAHRALPLAF
jgi:hypothetical protein